MMVETIVELTETLYAQQQDGDSGQVAQTILREELHLFVQGSKGLPCTGLRPVSEPAGEDTL